MVKNRIIKAGIGYTIGNYLIKGIGFLTVPIFTRLLTVADYGLYNTFFAYEAIFYLFICFSLHTCLKNAKYKYSENFSDFCSSCILLICLTSFVWFCIASIFVIFAHNNFVRQYNWLIVAFVVCCFSSSLLVFFNSYTCLDYDYKTYCTVAAMSAIGSTVISIFFICFLFKAKPYIGRILGTTIVSFGLSIFIVFYFWKKARFRFNKEYLRFGLRYSVPLIPHGVSQVILNQFDRIMITRMAGAVQSGLYSFAYNIFSIVQITGMSVDTVWSPWFYKKMHERDYDSIKNAQISIVFLVAGFMGFIIALSPEILMILGTKEYGDSVYCIIPLVVGGFFAFLYNFPVGIEYYFEKTKYIAIGTITAAIVNILLNLIFISKYGYIAAAYTTTITYMLYFIFHYCLSKKIFKKNLFSLKVFLFASVFIFVVAVFSLVFLKIALPRMIIASVILISTTIYEEKTLGIFGNNKIRKEL